MSLTVTDPFNKLPAELRLELLISTRSKESILRITQASPVMLQQYQVHKRHILRTLIAADFDEDMIQDAMAIILCPTPPGPTWGRIRNHRWEPTREHMRAWFASRLPNPLKDNNDRLLNKLDKLHSQLLLLIEDYITKATSAFPPREYHCLPQIHRPLAASHLMFKGQKVAPRFSSTSLTSSERKRFLKAFLIYELIYKTQNIRGVPNMREWRKISHAEFEAIGCVQSYMRSLYGAMFAQYSDASLPSTSTVAPTETGLPFPDTLYFDANAYASNLDLFYKVPDKRREDMGTCCAKFGLDNLTDFLRFDMSMPHHRRGFKRELFDVWDFEGGEITHTWEYIIDLLFRWKPKYENGFESTMYKQLSLDRYDKPRCKIYRQRAWVFFDDSRFYPQSSPAQPNFIGNGPRGKAHQTGFGRWKREFEKLFVVYKSEITP